MHANNQKKKSPFNRKWLFLISLENTIWTCWVFSLYFVCCIWGKGEWRESSYPKREETVKATRPALSDHSFSPIGFKSPGRCNLATKFTKLHRMCSCTRGFVWTYTFYMNCFFFFFNLSSRENVPHKPQNYSNSQFVRISFPKLRRNNSLRNELLNINCIPWGTSFFLV